jgi:hypothetical protein
MVMMTVLGADPATMWSSCTGSTTDLPDSVTEAPGAPAPTGKSTTRELRAPYSGPVLLTVDSGRQVQIAAASGVARISLASLAQQAGVDVTEVSASVPNNLTPRSVHASISEMQSAATELRQRHADFLQQRQLDRQKAAMCFDTCGATRDGDHARCDAMRSDDGKVECLESETQTFGACIEECKSTWGFDIYKGEPGPDMRPDPYGDR